MKQPLILAIDTSCDETAAAVSRGRKILSNVIASQINIHQKYGGGVPHLAKRAHEQKIDYVVREALSRARRQGRTLTGMPGSQPSRARRQAKGPTLTDSLDAIAVTVGPGLAPALEVGIATARKLAAYLHLPLIAVNHMEGHLLSPLALPNTPGVKKSPTPGVSIKFPLLALLVSGGHTQLVLVHAIGRYQLLGETLDDAAGEALDKLAKMLKLGYPGGPIIEELARKASPLAIAKIPLPVPMQHSKDLNFSFSGLKTAALYIIQNKKGQTLSLNFTHNLAASFQKAVADSLTGKLELAIKKTQPKGILLGGGVISNLYIRRQLRRVARGHNLPVYLPFSKKLFTDNAAMIAVAAYFKFLKKDFVKNPKKLDRQPSLNFKY